MTEPPGDQLNKLKAEALAALSAITTSTELEQWRVTYLGRKGAIPQLLRTIKDLPEADRRLAGQAGNQVRHELEEAFNKTEAKIAKQGPEDITTHETNPELTTDNLQLATKTGHLHPITLATRRIQDIMAALGFTIVNGPEVEQEYYDFDALNIPFEHPTRNETDSFYLHPRTEPGQGLVLRTSTSAVQVRTVIEENLIPPFNIASLGRVFRNEKPDATHESTFHQIEALMIGEHVTTANYKYVTETLFSTFFDQKVRTRLRPGYFPFVEPGFEIDMSCVFCQTGCRICKQTQWLEMGGAGMVHPNVLKNMNVDPDAHQGFAFGYGIDRFAMLKYGIDDIRLFWSGDIRFLRQFS